jgi:hypothetical protein
MIVWSDGKKPRVRVDKECKLSRNGDFIQIHYIQNKKIKFIRILEKRLEKNDRE